MTTEADMGVMRLHAEGHRGPPRAAGTTGSRTEAQDGFSLGPPEGATLPTLGLQTLASVTVRE